MGVASGLGGVFILKRKNIQKEGNVVSVYIVAGLKCKGVTGSRRFLGGIIDGVVLTQGEAAVPSQQP